MAEIKTKATTQNVKEYLNNIELESKRVDSFEILRMMEEASGEKPILWGTRIIGFGKYHYKSEKSSQEGDWPLIGFGVSKTNLTLYIMPGFNDDKMKSLLDKLGKHKTSVGCLYINKLADVDKSVLQKVIDHAYKEMKAKHKA
jgi:hypothetical protein